MTAVLLALVGAGQVSAMRSEEADGHLKPRGPARGAPGVARRSFSWRWWHWPPSGRRRLFAWAGAASQHGRVPFSGLVRRAHIVPSALSASASARWSRRVPRAHPAATVLVPGRSWSS